MPSKDPDDRSRIGKTAAQVRWAMETDRAAATAPGRAAAEARFEKLVDPDGVLDPVERARHAELLRSAHFRQMGRKSAKSRARSAAARRANSTAPATA